MPRPSSHQYDEERKQLRKEYENSGITDQEANDLANAELQGKAGNEP